MSSSWMSLGVRCRFGLKVVPASGVNSPDLRKPKTPSNMQPISGVAHIGSCYALVPFRLPSRSWG